MWMYCCMAGSVESLVLLLLLKHDLDGSLHAGSEYVCVIGLYHEVGKAPCSYHP